MLPRYDEIVITKINRIPHIPAQGIVAHLQSSLAAVAMRRDQVEKVLSQFKDFQSQSCRVH